MGLADDLKKGTPVQENLQIEVIPGPRDSGSTIAVAGELDADNCQAFASTMTELDGSLTINLAGLSFIDSSGISVILDRRNLALEAGHRFTVEGASGQVARVFTISGVDSLFAGGEQ